MESSKFVAALRIGLSRRDGLLHEKAQCAFPHWAFYAVTRPSRNGGDTLFVLAKSRSPHPPSAPGGALVPGPYRTVATKLGAGTRSRTESQPARFIVRFVSVPHFGHT